MAEGFSAPPPDEIEQPKAPLLDAMPRKRGIKGFLESLRPNNTDKEKKDDDDEELSPRESRVSRLLKRIFGGIVGKEEVPHEQRDRGSIFFGVGEVGEPEDAHKAPVVETTTEVETPTVEGPTVEAPPAEAVTETVEVVPDDVPAEIAEADPIEASVEPEAAVVLEEAVEVIPALEPAAAIERPPENPETVYVDRRRYREKEVYRETKKVEHNEYITEAPKKQPASAERPPEVVYERPRPVTPEQRRPVQSPKMEARPEARIPERQNSEPRTQNPERAPERKRTITSETTPEQQRQAVEKAVERHGKELSSEKKQEAIERILVAPEFKGALNTEIQKEITYEKSHESKDMDAQSQSAWAALQAAADATAKVNAKALAEAANQIPTANSGDALKKAVAQQAQDQKDLYKKAAISGFVTAVVIVAILFIVLIAQRK